MLLISRVEKSARVRAYLCWQAACPGFPSSLSPLFHPTLSLACCSEKKRPHAEADHSSSLFAFLFLLILWASFFSLWKIDPLCIMQVGCSLPNLILHAFVKVKSHWKVREGWKGKGIGGLVICASAMHFCRKLFRVIFFILVKKVVGTRKSLMGNSKLTVDAKKRMNMCFNVESRKW